MLVIRGHELARRLDEIVSSRDAVLAIGEGRVEGEAAAALMFSDWAVLAPDAELFIDTPAAWAGAVWRLGRSAPTVLRGAGGPPAQEALRLGLCDAIGDAHDFLGTRSELALDVAAALIRSRGGDRLERASFAWLFSTGAPAEGLRAFLEKRPPLFRRSE